MNTDSPTFKKCSSCKKEISWNEKYWICSVSSCNRQRTGLSFCSVACFDAHLPILNHKSAGAIEQRAPRSALAQAASASESTQTRASRAVPSANSSSSTPNAPRQRGEILVVVSKVKEYIAARSGFQTSDRVMEILSDKIRTWLDDAIRRAVQEERQTVMDRDVPKKHN